MSTQNGGYDQIDDTANPKYGKGILGLGHWHSSAGPFFGQKILVIALINMRSGIVLPIHYAFARKADDPGYKSLPLLAADLLEECIEMGFPSLAVTSDSWFDAAPMMNRLEEIGLVSDDTINIVLSQQPSIADCDVSFRVPSG